MLVYGRGKTFVADCTSRTMRRALSIILRSGRTGESYNVGGGKELRNLDLAEMVYNLLDQLANPLKGKSRRELITFVADRPEHNARYTVDGRMLREEFGWRPQENFENELRGTVEWYIANEGGWIRCGKWR